MKVTGPRLVDSHPSPEAVICTRISGGGDCPWHRHQEIEILLFISGATYRCIGENISPITPGTVVLLGPNVRHGYSNRTRQGTPRRPVEAISIKFNANTLGDWLKTSDARMEDLFAMASHGIHVTGETRNQVASLILSLPEKQGLQRAIQVFQILILLSTSNELSRISAVGCRASTTAVHSRMERVDEYLRKRIGRQIYLRDVATHVEMSPARLSRYFRLHIGKTFPAYLNSFRISRVCRLLRETDATVSEIAAECGFESMANFERQFRKLTGTSPRMYRRRALNAAGA
ncbi:AraC-like DNA-binding protein [Roseimicrobium gellanilyticum]|uniref:AraC-like DNA-binding protein n=1 Tax=Roseimicrobium gellanilyticum TaxID=748857 RepID=A0A366H9H2_9BACT|nr:AraC family transcriptional regulator [Roseimicrobium gellanilyticum]RBP38083.1 AraC-like DNA-binding protein [Roseimicrobium gellanilyticum]